MNHWMKTSAVCFEYIVHFISLLDFFFRDKTGKFPDYPDDDEGGSAAIFKEKDPLEVIAASGFL